MNGVVGRFGSTVPIPAAARRAVTIAAAVGKRDSGLRAKARITTSSTEEGRSPRTSRGGMGVWSSRAANMPIGVSALKGKVPVSSS